MPLTFEKPLWLLVALVAIPMAWAALRWLNAMTQVRKWSAVVARTLLVGLVAAMLAGASTVQTTDRLAVIGVIDISDSLRTFADQFADFAPTTSASTGSASSSQRPHCSQAVQSWLKQASDGRKPDDLLGVVVFDGSTAALAVPSASGTFDVAVEQPMAQGTDIGDALSFARSLFPAGANRRLVLISDGNQTAGDALAASEELASDSIPVDVVPVAYSVRNEVLVESVDAPPQASEGSTVRVRVVLQSTDAATGTLELLYEGRPIDINGDTSPGTGRRLALAPGRTVETIDVPLTEGTVHRFEPVFAPDNASMDRIAANNRAATFTVTPGKGRVLVVDGVSRAEANGPGRILSSTLERNAVAVTTVAPDAMPSDLLSLHAFDLVILENVAADELPRQAQATLADYVQKLGGGLVMVGGPDSFGAGGWKGTPIEPILPVRLDLPEQIIAPPAAVALVLDRSGSMQMPLMGGSRSKQEIANEGAALAILAMDKTDVLCVIAFDADYSVVIEPTRNTDAKANAATVRAINARGGTSIGPALERAGEELARTNATVKHIILLTDGRDEGGGQNLPAIAQSIRAKGITISTIGVGDDVDADVMRKIAVAGKGKYYQVIDPNVLPRVFVKEIRVVRKPLVRESPFAPRIADSGSSLIQGLGALPRLGGLVLTQARRDPKVTTSLVTPEGEPVLANWFAGRGQVAAFTSDAHKWAERWLDWPGYSMLWTRIARTISRPATDTNAELSVQIEDDELRIRLDASDDKGRALDMLNVPGTIYQPDGTPQEIRLGQTGPGSYEARIPARQTGTYIVALAPTQGERRLSPLIGGASTAIGPELRRLRSDVSLLERIAKTTGGRVLDLRHPELAQLFAREGVKPARATLPLWRTLLLWCIGVFLFDVGTRRVAWDRLVSRQWRDAVREQTAGVVKARADRAAATLAGLKRAAEKAPAERAAKAPLRPTPLQQPSPPPQSDEDDQRAAREAAALEARKKAVRAQMLRARSAGPAGPTEKTSSPVEKPQRAKPSSTPDPEAAPTSDLLAAKRRARERFRHDQDESTDG